MDQKTTAIVSTYIHVPSAARLSHSVDVSSFGTSASVRVGSHGENDAVLFFRSAEQLERLAEEAAQAAKALRQAELLSRQIAATRS